MLLLLLPRAALPAEPTGSAALTIGAADRCDEAMVAAGVAENGVWVAFAPAGAVASWSLPEPGRASLLLLANALLLLLVRAVMPLLLAAALACTPFCLADSSSDIAGAAAAAAAAAVSAAMPTPAGNAKGVGFSLTAGWAIRPESSRYCFVSSSELLGVHCSGSCC